MGGRGAKSGNKLSKYTVRDNATGEYFKFAEGSKIQNSEVFAGKGTKTPLHNGVADGLTREYGGNPNNWQHSKGLAHIDYYGESRKAEVHWFQEKSVGKVKFKIKRWLD